MHSISSLRFFVTPAFTIELDSEISATNGDRRQSVPQLQINRINLKVYFGPSDQYCRNSSQFLWIFSAIRWTERDLVKNRRERTAQYRSQALRRRDRRESVETRLRTAFRFTSWNEAAVVTRDRVEWKNIRPIIHKRSRQKVIFPSMDFMLVHRKALRKISSNKVSSR